MFRHVLVRSNELGLRFREGNFIGVVGPGRYTLFAPPWDTSAETLDVVDLRRPRFEHPKLRDLIRDHELRERLVVAEVEDGQQGLLHRGGQVVETLGPGLHAYWQNPADPIRIEVVPAAEVGCVRVWGQPVRTRQGTDQTGASVGSGVAPVTAAACA